MPEFTMEITVRRLYSCTVTAKNDTAAVAKVQAILDKGEPYPWDSDGEEFDIESEPV